MKKILVSVIAAGSLCISGFNLYAQKDSSGIYKTAADFLQRKLSYAINYKTEKHTINDNILFNDDKIKVKHAGQTYTLLKSETYGYKDMKGNEFRFVDKKEYKILNPGEPLLIYVYQHLAHSPKEAEKYPPMYFFSVDAASAPVNLTKSNLKNAFPNDHEFHDALDAQFKEDKELITYDDFHKMYKLNHIYMSTVKH
jgi:hypothetical protein